jgi:hypothetical protein
MQGEARRHATRLRAFNYASAGAYFVTVCTRNKEPTLGEILGQTPRLSRAGEIVSACWREIPVHFPGVELDVFVVMPNHIHGVLFITTVGATHTCPDRRYWVRRPYEPFTLLGLKLALCPPSSVPSSRRQPVVSTRFVAPQGRPSGNAVSTIT